jgi:hypothetical protein
MANVALFTRRSTTTNLPSNHSAQRPVPHQPKKKKTKEEK